MSTSIKYTLHQIIMILICQSLIFKFYKKPIKQFVISFAIYKVLTGYYQKNKERLQKKVHEMHQNLSEEEKNKKCQYACKFCGNVYKEEKNKKRQYCREQYKNISD